MNASCLLVVERMSKLARSRGERLRDWGNYLAGADMGTSKSEGRMVSGGGAGDWERFWAELGLLLTLEVEHEPECLEITE